MATKSPVAASKLADATQPSRTLRILSQLRGENPKALLEGYDAEQDPALAAYVPDEDEVEGALIGNPGAQPPRAAKFRGTSPSTRR